MPYRCCACCADDPSFHEDNPPDSHTVTCGASRPCPDGGRGDRYIPAMKQEGTEQ